jgi:CrcB protein
MKNILWIGLGGFLGSILRYIVSGAIHQWHKGIDFPYGTLVVNLIGCLLIGTLSQVAETRGIIGPQTRMFLFIGVLGSFTTFSTFGNETLNLVFDRNGLLALANVGLHIFAGLAAVWLGRVLAMQI